MLDMILVGFVALIQVYIMIFEIFMWERRGPKVFGSFPEDLFQKTTALAGNQGLYNGFLAAGLIWSAVRFVDCRLRTPRAGRTLALVLQASSHWINESERTKHY